MGFELPDGKTARNLQEQVKFLSEKLKDLYAAVNKIGIRVLVVDELPEEGEPATIYLVPAEDASQENIYNEYMWIEDEWELIGSTAIDLSDYMTLSTDQTVSGEKTFSNGLDTLSIDFVDTTWKISGDTTYDQLQIIKGNNPIIKYTNTDVFPRNNQNLGSSTYEFKNLYLTGSAYFNSNAYITDGGTSGAVLKFYRSNVLAAEMLNGWLTNYGGVRPNTGATYDLGDSTRTWRNLYLNGELRLATSGSYQWLLKSDGINIYIGSYLNGTTYDDSYLIKPLYFSPKYNGTNSLGETTRRWKDLYLSGNISDGTNSVSVADLAALITYAKGQGWIS